MPPFQIARGCMRVCVCRAQKSAQNILAFCARRARAARRAAGRLGCCYIKKILVFDRRRVFL